jgi:hypothetical protein
MVLTPSQAAAARVGQSTTIDAVEWIIAGTATTLPD